MGSNIFENLLKQKIDIFANTFDNGANSLFKSNDKLFHPLEYGMYREKCAKELLGFIVDGNTSISDGFIITSNNSVSTQCDIIFYNKDTIPLISNGIAKFFPIETVSAVGEIKSNLNKQELKEALIKIAKTKLLSQENKGIQLGRDTWAEECKDPVTFLICNKIECDITKLIFEEIYVNIPVRYRHNAILSLQDGLIVYDFYFSKLPPKQKKRFIDLGRIINDDLYIWIYPCHIEEKETYVCEIGFYQASSKDRYYHIIEFFTLIKESLNEKYKYDFDFIHYLGLQRRYFKK